MICPFCDQSTHRPSATKPSPPACGECVRLLVLPATWRTSDWGREILRHHNRLQHIERVEADWKRLDAGTLTPAQPLAGSTKLNMYDDRSLVKELAREIIEAHPEWGAHKLHAALRGSVQLSLSASQTLLRELRRERKVAA